MNHQLFDHILSLLEDHQCSLGDLLTFPLTTRALRHHPVHQTFATQLPSILSALNDSPQYSAIITAWASRLAAGHLSSCLHSLTDIDSGWHFNALHATPTQIEDFQFHDLARDIKKHAPELWDLIRALLSKNSLNDFGSTRARNMQDLERSTAMQEATEDAMEMDEEEAVYWANDELATEEVEGLGIELTDDERKEEKQRLHEYLLDIVSVKSFWVM